MKRSSFEWDKTAVFETTAFEPGMTLLNCRLQAYTARNAVLTTEEKSQIEELHCSLSSLA